MDYVHVSPRAEGSVFKGKVDGERTEFRENFASSSHRRNMQAPQNKKSLKEESSKVEKVDVVDGKGQKPQWGMPCRSCAIRHAPESCPAAARRRCHKCKKMNHFSRMCPTSDGQKKKQVNTLDV